MSRLGYRSQFVVDGADETTLNAATGHLWQWLKSKSYAPELLRTNATATIGQGVTALLLHADDGDRPAVRAQIEEKSPKGMWVTELTAALTGEHRMTVCLDILTPESERQTWSSTPRLARALVDEFAARDGSARLTSRPTRIRGTGVDEVLHALRAPGRSGMMFVVGTNNNIPAQPWFEYADKLLRETIGLGAAYILDSKATAAFNAAVGAGFTVPGGTIRIFAPGVNLADPLDGRRHQLLSTDRIVRSHDNRLQRLLGWRARDVAVERALAHQLRPAAKVLRDLEDSLFLENLTRPEPEDPYAPDASTSTATADGHTVDTPTAGNVTEEHAAPSGTASPQVPDAEAAEKQPPVASSTGAAAAFGVLLRVVGVAEPSPAAWQRLEELARIGLQAEKAEKGMAGRLRELRDDLEFAEEERREAQWLLEEAMVSEGIALDELDQMRARTARLERLLLQQGRAEDVYAEQEELESPPGTMMELLERLDEVEELEFTGNADAALFVDQRDTLGLTARKAWTACLALRDYVRCKAQGLHVGNVQQYLEETPQGCTPWPATRHAQTESESVRENDAYARHRHLPVPTDVDESGKRHMWAHFKISQFGRISPRMHYLDHSTVTGKVYIGHIGRHLPLPDGG